MNDFVLDINADAAVVYSKRLEDLSRSAFPVAVRGALNAAAFDVKMRTLDLMAKENFIRRSPTFFKRFSGVNRATGFDVNSMRAEVGMTAMEEVKAQTAIQHMEQQEEGGNISGGLDYLKAARSGSNRRMVKQSNYFDKANILTGAFRRSGTAKSNRVAAAYAALNTGKLMKFKANNGNTFYSKVVSISSNRGGKNAGTLDIKTQLIAEVRSSVSIKGTHFSREAAMITMKWMPHFYFAEAEKQFTKALKL